MKRKTFLLNVAWSILLLAAVTMLLVKQLGNKKTKPAVVSRAVRSTLPKGWYTSRAVFGKPLLDSMLKCNRYAVLSVSITDCPLCHELSKISIPKHLQAARISLDINVGSSNLLLTQALHTPGFPTTYVVNKEYNVVGIVSGLDHFQSNLDSIIAKKAKRCPIRIAGDVKRGKELQVLSNALKALVAHLERNNVAVYTYAHKSLNDGSYFFNNYLLYDYFMSKGQQDSAAYYKRRALRYTYRVNQHIYKSLIKELSPIKQ